MCPRFLRYFVRVDETFAVSPRLEGFAQRSALLSEDFESRLNEHFLSPQDRKTVCTRGRIQLSTLSLEFFDECANVDVMLIAAE